MLMFVGLYTRPMNAKYRTSWNAKYRRTRTQYPTYSSTCSVYSADTPTSVQSSTQRPLIPQSVTILLPRGMRCIDLITVLDHPLKVILQFLFSKVTRFNTCSLSLIQGRINSHKKIHFRCTMREQNNWCSPSRRLNRRKKMLWINDAIGYSGLWSYLPDTCI